MNITIERKIADTKNTHIFQLVETILKNHYTMSPFLIGISGAGGAGKTTFAKNLCEFIGKKHSLTIDLDDYLISRQERGKLEVTGYNPIANKLHLARNNLEGLKLGKSIKKPKYVHRTGEILPEEEIEPKEIIIAEGVTALYPELRELYNLSFFLDAPNETQMKSRITRDVRERGYTLEEAIALFHAVQPDYKRFIEPTKAFADVVVHVSIDYVMTVTHITERFR